MRNRQSPCERCARVQNPDGCENKNCKVWKVWFLHRWAEIHRFGVHHGCAGKGKSDELEK